MPARVSARSSTASRVSRKSSVNPAQVTIPDEGPTTALRANICAIFADAQKTTAGHRKLVVTLRKIHEACCYEPTNPGKKKGLESYDEDDFNVEIARCVIRLVAVKKTEGVGDRIVRFLGQFLHHASEKGRLACCCEKKGHETLTTGRYGTRSTGRTG